MIGDKIDVKPEYLKPAYDLWHMIENKISNHQDRDIISVAGESGSGKSTLALALQSVMAENHVNAITIHMDDYYCHPPLTNHHLREKDINHVGISEVNLSLLDEHLQMLKSQVTNTLTKPLSDNTSNSLQEETIYLNDTKVIIVEGTYVSILQHVDYKIFLERTYQDTFEDRKKRARDPITPFVETVLEIEHQILQQHKIKNHFFVDKNFSVR